MTGIDLRLLRFKHDITQLELATALKMSTRTIGRWEHSAHIPEIARLAIMELQGTKAQKEATQ